MSASEKLNAQIESAMQSDNTDYWILNIDGSALASALPRIVAVVEYLEREHSQPHMFGAQRCPGCNALAAREEALNK
jgi:hypothetical protein